MSNKYKQLLFALIVSLIMACSGGGSSISIDSISQTYDAIGAVTIISSGM